MIFNISFDVLGILRQFINLNFFSLSNIADIFRSFWAFVSDFLRVFGL